MKVNIDHRRDGNGERGFLEGFGELRNVRRDGDRVAGDLHFLKSHPAADAVCESAERFPLQFGLSHDAEGEVASRGGKCIVESVKKVNSVDIVGRPATNAGIFESVDPTKGKTMKTTIRKMIESKGSVLQKKRLLEMDGESPVMDAEMELPAETESASGEDQIWAAFKQAIIAAVDDDKLDTKATLAKIKDILNAYDKVEGKPTAKSEGGDPPADSPVAESIRLLTSKLNLMESRDTARAMLDEHGIPASETRIKLLAAASESDRKSLLEEFRSASPQQPRGVQRPPFSAPLRESTGEVVKYPEDAKSFSRSILG